MKRKLIIIGVLLTILTGIGIMIFPIISSLYADQNHSQVIKEYDEDIQELTDEAIEKAWAAARSYNDSLHALVQTENPFTEEFRMRNSSYEDLLNINQNGIMSYIRIPDIDVYLPIYHGTKEDVLSKGAGHLVNSSLPIGGASSNTVISAHTAYPGAEMFNRLTELTEGDVFYLHTLDQILAYKVELIQVVRPHETDTFQIVEGEDYATLVTCYPYGVNTHRLIVRGSRILYEEEEKEIIERQEQAKEELDWSPYMVLLIMIIALLFGGIGVYAGTRLRRKEEVKHER